MPTIPSPGCPSIGPGRGPTVAEGAGEDQSNGQSWERKRRQREHATKNGTETGGKVNSAQRLTCCLG